jgi:hypothetical protein
MSFTLSQKITYWTIASVDKNSTITFNSAVTISARYTNKDGTAINAKGEEQNTKWVIYSKIEIPKRSLVVLGTDTSVYPPNGAREMIDNKAISSFTSMIKSMA